MKHTFLLSITLLTLLVGCTKSSKDSSSTSSSNNNISEQCAGAANYSLVGCPGYCSTNPLALGCAGTTTGSTTGGSTGTSYTTIPKDNNWAALYPNGEPAGSCASPTGTGYDLRKGTVTMSGGVYYSADLSWTGVGESEYTSIRYSHNVSDFLTSPTDAASFLDTDSVLRVRFKPRPEPKAPIGKSWCFGRATGQSADYYGYTKLRFTVAIKGTDGILRGATSVTADVNSCTSTVDFSNYITSNGTIVIRDVYSNQGCTYQQGCTAWTKVRDAACWQMDVEVQVDGTKSI